MEMKKDELPQEMVDRQKKEGYASDPFVKMRDKIFGPDKPKPEPVKKKKGGAVVYKSGGKVRGCGIAQKGLTKGRVV